MSRLIAIATTLIMLALLAYGIDQNGYRRADTTWQKKEAARLVAETKAVVDRLAENEQAKAEYEAEKQRMKKGFADEIARSRARSAAAPGLRVGPAICSGFAGKAEANSAGGSDGGDPATRLVPQRVDEDFRALELEIEEVFAGCRVAQDFLKVHGMAP